MESRYTLFFQGKLRATDHYMDGHRKMLSDDDESQEYWLPCFNKHLAGYEELEWNAPPPTTLVMGAVLNGVDSYETFKTRLKSLTGAEFVKTSEGPQLMLSFNEMDEIVEVDGGLILSRFTTESHRRMLRTTSSKLIIHLLTNAAIENMVGGEARTRKIEEVLEEAYGPFADIEFSIKERFLTINVHVNGFTPLSYNLHLGDVIEDVAMNPAPFMTDEELSNLHPAMRRPLTINEYLNYPNVINAAIIKSLSVYSDATLTLRGEMLRIEIGDIKYEILIKLDGTSTITHRGYYT